LTSLIGIVIIKPSNKYFVQFVKSVQFRCDPVTVQPEGGLYKHPCLTCERQGCDVWHEVPF